jgi:bifunctional DNA-binding transcriptional regulator/antitoxin component of YhaV-PrlF toxin-antitoxin module
MNTSTIMRVTKNGQISLPAEIRHRWKTDRVIVIDLPHGVLIRPFDPDAVRRLHGKYKHLGGPTVDEDRAAARAEDAEDEDRWKAERGLA